MKLIGDTCDRCGKQKDVCPYKLTQSITFRGKVIVRPWLCESCTRIERIKAWRKA